MEKLHTDKEKLSDVDETSNDDNGDVTAPQLKFVSKPE